jgi:hypothetical protein
MRGWITAGLTCMVLTFGVAAAAGDVPIKDSFPVDTEPFQLDDLTVACGVPVMVEIHGTFSIKGFIKDQTVVREIDTQPGTKLTYTTEGGGSITIPFSGALHATYPEGAVIGAPAIVTLTGNTGPFNTEIGPGSGRLVFDETIEDITEDGIPLVRLTTPVAIQGNFSRQTARICAALTS